MVIVARPCHDLATTYLCAFSQEAVDLAKKKNRSVIDLKGSRANRKLFESCLRKRKIEFIFINGHGSEISVSGHNNETIIDGPKKEFQGAIFYCRSCQTATRLGKELVKAGARAYLGYIKDYYLLQSKKFNTKPLKDKTAKLFLEPSNLIASSIIKGNTVYEADRKSKDLMKKNIREVLSSSWRDKDEVAAYLVHNLKVQVVIGDSQALI